MRGSCRLGARFNSLAPLRQQVRNVRLLRLFFSSLCCAIARVWNTQASAGSWAQLSSNILVKLVPSDLHIEVRGSRAVWVCFSSGQAS